MHYIRFLKPPQITASVLTAKLTITTDLGDDFLNADLPLQLIICHSATHTIIGNPSIVQWKAGSRELAVSIPLPTKEGIPKEKDSGWQLLVWPCLTGLRDEKGPIAGPVKYNKKSKPLPPRAPKIASHSTPNYLLNMSDILAINRGSSQTHPGVKGLVLAAKSAAFNLINPEQKLPASIERAFGMRMDGKNEGCELVVEEETGNSIARHVWYVFSPPSWFFFRMKC